MPTMPLAHAVATIAHLSFVDRHDLWSAEQRRAAAAVEREIKRRKLEVVRFAFCDQHGVLRGKTLVASEAASAMRAGVTMTSTLLAKDTSHRTVFPVFAAGGGMGLDEMAGRRQFRHGRRSGDLPRAALGATTPAGCCATSISRTASRCRSRRGRSIAMRWRSLPNAGFDFLAGLEVEFHLFKLIDPKLAPDSLTWPAEAPAVEHTTHGFQYLTESRFDQVDPILERSCARPCRRSACRCVSLEVELGPSQYEFTFAPQHGLAAADTMVLFRSAMKQVARRHGYLVSFMCRPRSAQHLRQRLASASVAARSQIGQEPVRLATTRPNCCRRSAGTISRACSRMRARRRRSPRRPSTATSAITASTRWRRSRRSGRRDNRGVMIRVLGEPGDPSTHLENRVGEPLANPYLYMASQIHAGLDGIARKLKPGPSADAPYEISAEPLPKSLAEALAALQGQRLLPRGLRRRLRRLLPAASRRPRSRAATPRSSGQAGNATDVTAWEHKEYFDLA